MADKRLFEQPLLSSPDYTELENRLAFGRAGVATKNITLNQLLSWLNSKLGFLRPSNNLNDLQNKATARNNLNVYSKDEVYNKSEVDYSINTLQSKIKLFTVAEMGYITVGAGGAIGYSTITNNLTILAERMSTGKYRIIHNLNTWNHQVIAMVDSPADQQTGALHRKISQISRYENYDIIYISNADNLLDLLEGQNIFVMIILFA